MNFNSTLKQIMIKLIEEYKETHKKSTQGRHLKESLENYVDSFFYVLKTGCNWNILPSFKNFNLHFSSYNKKFNELKKNEIIDQLLNISLILSSYYNKTNNYFIDSTTIKNLKSLKSSGFLGHSYKIKTKLSTKVTILINDNGFLVSIHYSKSSDHDIKFVILCVTKFKKINENKLNKSVLIGDKGYHFLPCARNVSALCRNISNKLKNHLKLSFNINYCYPSRSNSKNNNSMPNNHSRFINEQIFFWINNYKRILSINEKYYSNFVSLYNLAVCDLIFKKIDKMYT